MGWRSIKRPQFEPLRISLNCLLCLYFILPGIDISGGLVLTSATYAQDILTKFEFFPIKCRIQRAAENFEKLRKELLDPQHQADKEGKTLPLVKTKVLATLEKMKDEEEGRDCWPLAYLTYSFTIDSVQNIGNQWSGNSLHFNC
jgi:hypothetical protein